jgi:hypothetical protein
MNRYLIRALVAVLTFCIGVAVGSLRPRTSKYRCKDFTYTVKSVETESCRRRYSFSPTPFLSVDTASTDPVRLTYSATNANQENTQRQSVEFLVENVGEREIRSVNVGFNASRYRGDRGQYQRSGWRVVDNRTQALSSFDHAPAIVAIDCGADETLAVWVSSVEFKDGYRWINPRHTE